ncbi:MAG: exodeoxyribonuclease VII small subunit [Candidatus Omnitrophica bacterium]|nr:exodeoxyribonuclease VII small subunit [Candidatus Omnitrophota bacterium]
MTKKTLKYKDAEAELAEILEDLQSERVDVDEISDRVRRAIELIRFCKEKIEKTEMEVKKVIKDFEKELSGESSEEDE